MGKQPNAPQGKPNAWASGQHSKENGQNQSAIF
jgi:hypothetical protein